MYNDEYNNDKIKWLTKMGEAAFGTNWKSELARHIGINDRSVRQWAGGERPIPDTVIRGLVTFLHNRATRIQNVAKSVAHEADELDGYERAIYMSITPDPPVGYNLSRDHWRWFNIDGITYGFSDTGIVVDVHGNETEMPTGIRTEYLDQVYRDWVDEESARSMD